MGFHNGSVATCSCDQCEAWRRTENTTSAAEALGVQQRVSELDALITQIKEIVLTENPQTAITRLVKLLKLDYEERTI